MAWTLTPAGSWGIAKTDSPGTDMAAGLALPGSWPIGQQPSIFVRNDQWATLLTPPGPPAGYVAWWDASAITGVADGASLTSWPDGSANHNDLGPGGGTPQYFKTTAAKLVNGKPAVWCNAGYLAKAGLTQAQPFTAVGVVKTTDNSAGPTWWDSDGNPNTFLRLSDGTWGISAGSNVFTSLVCAVNVAHFIVAGYNSTSSFVQQDGTLVSGLNPGSLGLSGAFHLASQYGWAGAICETIVYPGALSAGQIASLRSYAQAKWGTP